MQVFSEEDMHQTVLHYIYCSGAAQRFLVF